MDFILTDEQELLVRSLRAFIEKELVPYEDEVDRTGELPPGLGEQIRDRALASGFCAPNLPEEVGGGGLDYLTTALFERECGRTSWALQSWLARPSRILLACDGDQVETYLTPCARGERMECFALTEPGAGSDAHAIATRAVRDADTWVIDGTKHFISHADVADFAVVFAVTGVEETQRGPRNRVTAFLVDVGTQGFEVRRGRGPSATAATTTAS